MKANKRKQLKSKRDECRERLRDEYKEVMASMDKQIRQNLEVLSRQHINKQRGSLRNSDR
ncbi:MAG: hypothetical protein GX776_05515 [Oxalobacter sp.]|nr:hypothetical protein [Oxalobacter sp.]